MRTAHELSAHLAALLGKEHDAMADFLLALADFDRRKLWRDLGHASLFYFLHRHGWTGSRGRKGTRRNGPDDGTAP